MRRWAYLEKGLEKIMWDLNSGMDMTTVCASLGVLRYR